MADEASSEHEFLHRNLEWPVLSSNVASLRWDNEAELLFVRYLNGKQWKYGPVTRNMAEDLAGAPSVGTWIWDNIKVRGSVSDHQVPIAEEVT